MHLKNLWLDWVLSIAGLVQLGGRCTKSGELGLWAVISPAAMLRHILFLGFHGFATTQEYTVRI